MRYVFLEAFSLEPISLGQNFDQVESLIGAPNYTDKDTLSIEWSYNDINVFFDLEGEVCEIGFNESAELFDKLGQSLFSSIVFDDFLAKNQFFDLSETIVFPTLGLSFTGFRNEVDYKAITFFKLGYWDDFLSDTS